MSTRRAALNLLADIGGTNARFALADGKAGSAPFGIEILKVAEFADPFTACLHYLQRQGGPKLQGAAFALACPIEGDRAALTNAHWRFDRRELQHKLRVPRLLLLNDFEALAWSLPALRTHDGALVTRGRRGVVGKPLALIGPGTGLGVSGLLPSASGWVAVAGEGGHGTLAAFDAREAELLNYLWQTHAHVSWERLLCGSGLLLLLRAIAQVDQLRGTTSPDDYRDAAAVTSAALAGDPLALAAIRSFCALLGTAAGNLALTLGARGGLYVGGGIVPHFGRLFAESEFLARFEAKGRFRPYLAKIPVYLITAQAPALAGASFALAAFQQ